MHIDMDAYFASIEQVTNPFLKGKPIIVCGSYKTRSVVSSCSYEAKKYGIKSGMSVKQALNLCPDVIIVSGYPEKYAEVSKEIFSIIKSFTENMEIYSIDEVFLDISDIYHLYGGKNEGYNIYIHYNHNMRLRIDWQLLHLWRGYNRRRI